MFAPPLYGADQKSFSTNTSHYYPYFSFSKFQDKLTKTLIHEVENDVWKYHIELKQRRKWEMKNEAWWESNVLIPNKSISVSWCKQNPKRNTS